MGTIFTNNPRTGRAEFIGLGSQPYFNKYDLFSAVRGPLSVSKHRQLVVDPLNNFSRGGFGLQSVLTLLLNVDNNVESTGGDSSSYNRFLVDGTKLLKTFRRVTPN